MKLHRRTLDGMARALELEAFERSMVDHLRKFSPRHSSMLGDRGVLAVVRLGVERGRVHGIENVGLLRFYVELMFMYGSFFDTDPLLPWAGECLRDPALVDPEARAMDLYDRMSAYYDAVSGPDLSVDRAALRRGADAPASGVLPEAPDFGAELVATLTALHPARAAYLGEASLHELSRAAVERARDHAVGTAAGARRFAILMFTTGHGFVDDPVVPWARAALDPTLGDGPDARAARLAEAHRAYVARACEGIDRRDTVAT